MKIELNILLKTLFLFLPLIISTLSVRPVVDNVPVNASSVGSVNASFIGNEDASFIGIRDVPVSSVGNVDPFS